MTDQELLEKAAKAAEYWFKDDLRGLRWNPLTDDGDALRLAVSLGLVVSPWGGTIYVNKPGFSPVHCKEDFGPKGDPYAATRRAIVRAAAEMYKET